MPGKMVKKPELIGVSLLTLLAFALRLYQLGTSSLWYDELLELDVAQGSFWQIGPQLERHAAMPLDYYLLFGWIKWGRQEAWVRFPALFFGTLVVPVIFVLATRLFNKRVGYLAALLLAWSSFLVYYSQEVRPYALLLLLTTLSYLGVWQAYKSGHLRHWGLAISALAGAALTHYFALFLLLPLGLFVLYQQLVHFRQKKYWQHTLYFGLCIVMLLTIFTFNGRLRHLYNVGGRFSTVVSQPETLTLPPAEKPNKGSGPAQNIQFFTDSVLMPLATADPTSFFIYNALLIIAFLTLLLVKFRRRSAILLVGGWLFLPTLLIYFFLLQRGTFFAVRYILYTLPAYVILVAYGIDRVAIAVLRLSRLKLSHPTLSSYQLLYVSLVLLVTMPLILAELNELLTHYAGDAREDWRAVGQMLQANATPADAVIAVNAEPALNWYYPPAKAPFGLYNRSEPIWAAIKQHQRRWFVLSSYSFKRDEGLRQWLKEHQAVTIAIDRRVVVYVQQDGLTAGELLAQVRRFALPQKAPTYAALADQLRQHGDLESSRTFYERAIELAETPLQKIGYQGRLAALAAAP
jgi:4-amino-4-deoxy-L-arabinose transferase-like glycosyltransferase